MHFNLRLLDPKLPPLEIDQVCCDSRCIASKSSLFVALRGSAKDGHDYVEEAFRRGAQAAIVSEAWSRPPSSAGLLIRVPSPLKALQQLARAYRCQIPAKILAISGSYGKTAVKDLIAGMLPKEGLFSSPESFNSQIGVPLSLLRIGAENRLAILEIGISKPGEMQPLTEMVQPDFAVITNIADAHLSTLKSLEATAKEKGRLLESPLLKWSLTPESMKASSRYWDRFDPELPELIEESHPYDGSLPYRIEFPRGLPFSGKLQGVPSYSLQLIRIAVKAAWLLGAERKAIVEALKSYQAEPRETRLWRGESGETLINAGYSSDPQSLYRSLKRLSLHGQKKEKIFLFGGFREGDSRMLRPAAELLSGSDLNRLLLFGEGNFAPLIEELSARLPKLEVSTSPHLAAALKRLLPLGGKEVAIAVQGPDNSSLEEIDSALYGSCRLNRLTVDLSAVEQNLERIRERLSPGTRIMPMVKANGYGTDAALLSHFLAHLGIDIFGVSYVDEAVQLRRAGVSQALFVLNAAPKEAAKAIEWDLELGISDGLLLERLALSKKPLKVHLHVDTGMSRFGCRPEEALDLVKQISARPNLLFEGLFTHLSCADDPSQDPFTKKQADLFAEVAREIEKAGFEIPWKHLSNSSAALRFPSFSFNMARIGLALFGIPPSAASAASCPLKPSLSLSSQIVGVNRCLKGESVGYSRSYRVERENMRIAIVPIGYFDGLHRSYSGKAELLIRGKRAPMVGNICMDYMMVDVSAIPDAQIGDQVLLFGSDLYGNEICPAQFAERCGSIAHELITCLGSRIQRLFKAET